MANREKLGIVAGLWLWQYDEPAERAYLDESGGKLLSGFATRDAAAGECRVDQADAAALFEGTAGARARCAALCPAALNARVSGLRRGRGCARPASRSILRPLDVRGGCVVRDRLVQPDGHVTSRTSTALACLDFIGRRRVQVRRLLPALLLLELLRAVAADARGAAVTLGDARFRRPVDLDAPACDYLVQVDAPSEGARVAVWGRSADDAAAPWVEDASAACRLADTPPAEAEQRDWAAGGGWRELDVGALYARHQAGDIVLGEDFRCLAALRVRDACSEAEVGPPRGAGHDATQRAALLIDVCLQASAATREADDGLFLLAGVDEVELPLAEALARPVPETCNEGYRFTPGRRAPR